MNEITQTITEQNAEKVIKSLSGWKVDEHLAKIIFNNMFAGKQIKANYVSEVCDMYAAALWNMGAVS